MISGIAFKCDVMQGRKIYMPIGHGSSQLAAQHQDPSFRYRSEGTSATPYPDGGALADLYKSTMTSPIGPSRKSTPEVALRRAAGDDTRIAGAIFPKQAQGSLIERNGKVVGSALIGQEFKDDKYFHGRPSATTAPDPADATKTVPAPYNAANSGGSNLGPTSKALNDRIKEDVNKLKAENPSAAVPVDLVTTPAAGSIRISRRRARCSRCRGWRRCEICRKVASAN
jgi:hypothetical protein